MASAALFSGANAAFAAAIKGPSVSVEEAQAAPVVFTDQREDDPAPDLTIQRRRYEASILAPIPAKLLGGMFVIKADFFKESRIYAGDDAPNQEANDLKNPNVAGIGTVYLPHAKEGAPRFFIATARYGSMSLDDKAGPMSEYIVGADIASEDMPFRLTFSPTDDAQTRLLVRYRNFPGFHRWLFLVGHKIQTVGGWSIDITLPSHVLLAWQTLDDAWKVYGGVRWVSREYPFSTGVVEGWTEGHATSRLIGLRRKLISPLYVALEAGMQNETLSYLDEHGETLSSQDSPFAPWARVSLETWLPSP